MVGAVRYTIAKVEFSVAIVLVTRAGWAAGVIIRNTLTSFKMIRAIGFAIT